MNDITKDVKYSQICLFADDTVIYNSNPNKDVLATELQEDLNNINLWLTTMNLPSISRNQKS